jgi:geranylgeranyl diphosphate synthase type I
MRGGKRFRPALLVASYLAIDTSAPLEPALDAGIALELLQSYLLIHDDWMDRDEVRRGGPAVHVLLSRHFGSRLTGEASGVLAGDFAAALSLEAMARVRMSPERLSRALIAFAEIQEDAICGQQLDLAARPDNVEAMHELKTGSYTVRGPLLLGAHLGGASTDALDRLDRFARPLGVAFQLRDDLLGAFGDPATTGKPFGSDIRAGKRTTLLVEALARLGDAERRTIAETVGRRDASDAAIRRVIDLYEGCGARSAVERRLDELVASARSSLDTSCFAPGGSAYLIGAAGVLTRRQN